MHRAATASFKALAALVFCAIAGLGALTTTSPLTPDPPPVSPSALRSVRKSPEVAGDAGPAPVLATLVNTHTDEIVPLDEPSPSPERWALMLSDRVTGAQATMDPALLGMLRSLAARHPGARIEIVSGFRSPKLNEQLRKKGHRVASHSQHSLGHAVDFRLVGLSPARTKAEVRSLGWKGGVGQYDGASDRFVHIDVGRERNWHER
jgi:hypothetical protein